MMSHIMGQGIGQVLAAQQAAAQPAGRDKRRAHVRDPETFNGKDPEQLRTFLFQGVLNFNDRPEAFRSDADKVNYMVSYLTDDALGWFEPAYVNPDPHNVPAWLTNYDAFVAELQLNFGTYDPRQDAENEIVALHMADSQRIQKYLVKFNKLSQLTGWNSVALRKVFYDGLPERIQTKLRDLPGGKPATLEIMKISAQSIDASHWEWQKEQKLRRPRNPIASTSNPKPDSANKSGANATGGGSKPNTTSTPAPKGDSKKKSGRGNGGNPGRSPAQNAPSDKPYASLLGADGKLSEAERTRRMSENLCLFCGGSGHRATDCPKRCTSGRAATTANITEIPAMTAPSASTSGN